MALLSVLQFFNINENYHKIAKIAQRDLNKE